MVQPGGLCGRGPGLAAADRDLLRGPRAAPWARAAGGDVAGRRGWRGIVAADAGAAVRPRSWDTLSDVAGRARRPRDRSGGGTDRARVGKSCWTSGAGRPVAIVEPEPRPRRPRR